MPIRFYCKRCHQILGIASRKAGSEVECPKCGRTQTVPSEEAAEASMVMDKFSKTQQTPEDPASLIVYDDEPAVIKTPRKREKKKAADDRSGKSVEPQPAAEEPSSVGNAKPLPSGMILFPRRSLYVQGLLFLVLAATAFAAGYFIGRGDASPEVQPAQVAQAKQRMQISGKLVFDPGTGRIDGDENAVIIALPDNKLPETRLSSKGLRPHDSPPADTHRSVKAIVEFGGAYCRADASGGFSMVVPSEGTYRLLIVSRHATRPKDVELDEAQLVEMEEYFARAENLIGRKKYRWTSEEVNTRLRPIEINFGQSGVE
jgi:phage FluMu protein Com